MNRDSFAGESSDNNKPRFQRKQNNNRNENQQGNRGAQQWNREHREMEYDREDMPRPHKQWERKNEFQKKDEAERAPEQNKFSRDSQRPENQRFTRNNQRFENQRSSRDQRGREMQEDVIEDFIENEPVLKRGPKKKELRNEIQKVAEFKEVEVEDLDPTYYSEDHFREEDDELKYMEKILGNFEQRTKMAENSDPMKVLQIDLEQKKYSLDENGQILLPKFEYVRDENLVNRVQQRRELWTQVKMRNFRNMKVGDKDWTNEMQEREKEIEDDFEDDHFSRYLKTPGLSKEEKNKNMMYVEQKRILIDIEEKDMNELEESSEDFETEEGSDDAESEESEMEKEKEMEREKKREMEKKKKKEMENEYEYEYEKVEKVRHVGGKRGKDEDEWGSTTKKESEKRNHRDDSDYPIRSRSAIEEMISAELDISSMNVVQESNERLLKLMTDREKNFFLEFPYENTNPEDLEALRDFGNHLRRLEMTIYAREANESFKEWIDRKKRVWGEVKTLQAENPETEVLVIKQLLRKDGAEGEFKSVVSALAKKYVKLYAEFYDDSFRLMVQRLVKLEDLRLRENSYMVVLKGEELEIFRYDAEGGQIWQGKEIWDQFCPEQSGDETVEFEKYSREKRALRNNELENWRQTLTVDEKNQFAVAQKRRKEWELPYSVKERPHVGMQAMEITTSSKEPEVPEQTKIFPNKNAILNFVKQQPDAETTQRFEEITLRAESGGLGKDETAGFMSEMGVSSEYFKKQYDRVFAEEVSAEDRLEVRMTVAFLLEKSEEDFDRIKRFFITALTMSMHSKGLTSTTRRKARRDLQLHDEAYWFEHFLLKLCQGFYNTRYFPKSRDAVFFEVTSENVKALKHFRDVLAEGVAGGLPHIEPFNWEAQIQSLERAIGLMNHTKGEIRMI